MIFSLFYSVFTTQSNLIANSNMQLVNYNRLTSLINCNYVYLSHRYDGWMDKQTKTLKRGNVCIAFYRNSFQCYRASHAIWDHTCHPT